MCFMLAFRVRNKVFSLQNVDLVISTNCPELNNILGLL